jgi:serine/threonine protein phosphatase PrpC
MGNDLTNDKESDKEQDIENEEIKYGLISKKCKEKSNNDTYIISPGIKFSDNDKNIEYSLFGIFDGHNNNYISKYLSENIQKFFEKEIKDINESNYKIKIEGIFKEIDKTLREGQKTEKDDKKDINNSEIEVSDKEKEFLKNSIKNSQDIPEDLKEIDDNELEDLILFKNMFNHNNYLFNNQNNLSFIGSSASIVLINQDNIITIELGITKCFLFDKSGTIINYKNDIEEQNEKNKKEKKEKKEK